MICSQREQVETRGAAVACSQLAAEFLPPFDLHVCLASTTPIANLLHSYVPHNAGLLQGRWISARGSEAGGPLWLLHLPAWCHEGLWSLRIAETCRWKDKACERYCTQQAPRSKTVECVVITRCGCARQSSKSTTLPKLAGCSICPTRVMIDQ